MAVELDRLIAAIRESWVAGTAQDYLPTAGYASGQCCVSALIVQDYFGGEILRGTVNGVVHYWNNLPGNVWLDVTRDQFPAYSEYRNIETARSEQYWFRDTQQKYSLLRARVNQWLDYRHQLENDNGRLE